jgi:hypothetical protein
MFDFKIIWKYDIIFSHMSFQYVKNKKQFSEIINTIKSKTKKVELITPKFQQKKWV